MLEYIQLIIGIVGGGALSTAVTIGITRRSQKLDFAEKAIKFTEDYSAKLMNRIDILEEKVENLLNLKCENIGCKNRKPPRTNEKI